MRTSMRPLRLQKKLIGRANAETSPSGSGAAGFLYLNWTGVKATGLAYLKADTCSSLQDLVPWGGKARKEKIFNRQLSFSS
jgi:hypothetical protein